MTDFSDTVTQFMNDIKELISARYPLIYLNSYEEKRMEKIMGVIAGDLRKRLFSWTVTQGFQDVALQRIHDDTKDPLLTLDYIERNSEKQATIYILKDFHHYLNNPSIQRKLKDAIASMEKTNSSLFILSPVVVIPPELDKVVTLIDCPLPTKKDLGNLLADFQIKYGDQVKFGLDHRAREQITKSLLGLTYIEAENILARIVVKNRKLEAADSSIIIKEKEAIIRKSGLLEFYPHNYGIDDIGGLEILKMWLRQKSRSFDDDAAEFGVDLPKGVLLIGVSGCGKSLTAKAIAKEWAMPLLRFDLGRVFDKYVGQSEHNIRSTIKLAESIAPCVLWIDEMEKGFPGSGSPRLDSGVSTRVFSTMLTWMNDRTKPVFLVGTANDVSVLPPELLRKGRFDEIFFLDLPSAREREDIFRVHISSRKRDPGRFDLKMLTSLTDGFSGSDIEGVVKSAIEKAYVNDRRQVVDEDFIEAIGEAVPLSTLMKEQIEMLRNWARGRARLASEP